MRRAPRELPTTHKPAAETGCEQVSRRGAHVHALFLEEENYKEGGYLGPSGPPGSC